jgi:mRNA interferase RelE/StbE
MIYSLFILRRAQKELENLPPESYERVCRVILSLAQDPRPAGCKKLSGREGWRARVGVFRVVYEIDEDSSTVTVLHVGHRRDVYR